MDIILKFNIIVLLLYSDLPVSHAQKSGTAISRKILFSMSKNERPIFGESSIALSPNGTSVIVLTSDEEGRIFVYENGKKRGPFKDVNETAVILPEDNPEEYDPIYRRESDEGYENYLGYNDEGQASISFAGRSFGPYQFILEFYSPNDKSAFYAIVMKDSKPQIVTSSGSKVDLDGQPGYNYLSPSGKKFMVTTVKENNESGELLNRDLSKMSAEEITMLGKKIESKPTRPPEAYIWFQDGKKFGPYDPKKISANNPTFNKTGGDNWLLTMDSKLYINGITVKDLRNDQISPANVWLTEDGKRYVIIVYNRIEFSDGQVYKDPLKIRISVNKNIITLWWLLIENERDIVLYSKTL
jgi:hypothetical protein